MLLKHLLERPGDGALKSMLYLSRQRMEVESAGISVSSTMLGNLRFGALLKPLVSTA
jgi:hypothetical protein